MWLMNPSLTKISLGIRKVCLESSLCDYCISKDLRFAQLYSDDSGKTCRMSQPDLSPLGVNYVLSDFLTVVRINEFLFRSVFLLSIIGSSSQSLSMLISFLIAL